MKSQEIYYTPGLPPDEDAYGVENTTFKVRRMTQNRPNKQGMVKVEIEIDQYEYQGKGKYDRTRSYVNTNIWVNKGNWNNKTQKLSQKEPEYNVKSNKINAIFASIQSFIASKGKQEIDQVYGEGVDFSKVRELFPSRRENRKTFYDYLDKYYNTRKTDGDTADNTLKVVRTVANRVKAYDGYSKKMTYLEDINFSWSDNFNAWMVSVKKYSPSTIHRTYQIISVCLTFYWDRRDEYQILMNDKFKSRGFKFGKKDPNKPHALSYEQREIVFNHRFDQPYLEKARKMICIQSYTGCRYGDIKLFTPKCFKKPGKLIYTPNKTKRYGIIVNQPLHPKADVLFKDVNYDTTKTYSTSNQKYDKYIIEIFKILKEKYADAGFDDDFTSHNFRDTFISICVKTGVNFKSVLRWSGQKKYETLDAYIDLDDDFEKKEMLKTL